MPTSSAAGFELRWGAGVGVEAALAISEPPWQAAVGNKVRLVCSERFDRILEGAGGAGRVCRVAIGNLAAPGEYIRLLFALSSNFCFLFAWPSGQVFCEMV
jgi:hypothetical protein